MAAFGLVSSQTKCCQLLFYSIYILRVYYMNRKMPLYGRSFKNPKTVLVSDIFLICLFLFSTQTHSTLKKTSVKYFKTNNKSKQTNMHGHKHNIEYTFIYIIPFRVQHIFTINMLNAFILIYIYLYFRGKKDNYSCFKPNFCNVIRWKYLVLKML